MLNFKNLSVTLMLYYGRKTRLTVTISGRHTGCTLLHLSDVNSEGNDLGFFYSDLSPSVSEAPSQWHATSSTLNDMLVLLFETKFSQLIITYVI